MATGREKTLALLGSKTFQGLQNQGFFVFLQGCTDSRDQLVKAVGSQNGIHLWDLIDDLLTVTLG